MKRKRIISISILILVICMILGVIYYTMVNKKNNIETQTSNIENGEKLEASVSWNTSGMKGIGVRIYDFIWFQ